MFSFGLYEDILFKVKWATQPPLRKATFLLVSDSTLVLKVPFPCFEICLRGDLVPKELGGGAVGQYLVILINVEKQSRYSVQTVHSRARVGQSISPL